MEWFDKDGDPAYGMYADGERDRCPVCFVPTGAPHMNSCHYTGTWTGDEQAARRRPANESDY